VFHVKHLERSVQDELRSIPVHQVKPSPFQPRRHFDEAALEELAASIRMQGLLQPILVRSVGGHYELIAGERRWRATLRLGQPLISALVRPFSDEQALEAALIENLQREDISVVEEALAYRRLMEEFHYTQQEIGQRTGKARTTINNTMRLLHLPDAVLELLDAGDLSEGHARALLGLPYPSLQSEVAEWIVRNGVTVREVERKVRSLVKDLEPVGDDRLAKPRDVHIEAVEERLRDRFGTRARLAYRKGKGSIQLEFYSDEDLQRILELLHG
jgi:ParB family chromosome partitioning protein